MATSVFCIVPDNSKANLIFSELTQSGFSADDISVLLPDRSGSRDFAHEQHSKAPEGTVVGVGAGGAVGGAIGLLAGLGLLAIPGLGPLVAAGPIMAALSGAAAGATVGGVTGALVGMGMPEIEAKRYEGKVKDGNILMSVHCDDADEARRAKEIFTRHDATDISQGGERAPERPSATVREPARRM